MRDSLARKGVLFCFSRFNKFIGINFYIFYTDLITRIFQVFLNIIQAREYHKK